MKLVLFFNSSTRQRIERATAAGILWLGRSKLRRLWQLGLPRCLRTQRRLQGGATVFIGTRLTRLERNPEFPYRVALQGESRSATSQGRRKECRSQVGTGCRREERERGRDLASAGPAGERRGFGFPLFFFLFSFIPKLFSHHFKNILNHLEKIF